MSLAAAEREVMRVEVVARYRFKLTAFLPSQTTQKPRLNLGFCVVLLAVNSSESYFQGRNTRFYVVFK